ncbi:hypothetical protein [Thiolapillus sp.]|uniref:hypothetical protein n=1 Tax=Thiolapillus sp. TaxID=2017437 RepID=UPI003AF4CA1C
MDVLVRTSRLRVDTQRPADLQVLALRSGGLAHMQGMPVGLLKDGRDPDLARELLAQAAPASPDISSVH